MAAERAIRQSRNQRLRLSKRSTVRPQAHKSGMLYPYSLPANAAGHPCSASLLFDNPRVLRSFTHVKPEHLWRETDTFLTTIMAIRKALTSFYGGRFSDNGQ